MYYAFAKPKHLSVRPSVSNSTSFLAFDRFWRPPPHTSFLSRDRPHLIFRHPAASTPLRPPAEPTPSHQVKLWDLRKPLNIQTPLGAESAGVVAFRWGAVPPFCRGRLFDVRRNGWRSSAPSRKIGGEGIGRVKAESEDPWVRRIEEQICIWAGARTL